ncbi:MAG: RHS repeat-associated core domain-containing protein [Bacteroidota bacterium]
MKKFTPLLNSRLLNSLLVVYFTVFSFCLFAQPGPSDTDPSLSLLPPSPTAAALNKYIDFPVDYHSGSAQINIPIHNLGGRGLSVPISLSYHSGGVKIDEVSSTTGLGWSLNAGGMVSRTVVGKADERPDGFLQRGSQIPYPIDPSTNLTALQEFAEGRWDGQSDVFHFSAGSYSGKFVIESPDVVRLIPHQDLKVEYSICNTCSFPLNGSIIQFTITTPDGMIYTFGTEEAVEYSETSSYSLSGGNGACNVKNYDLPAVTGWYLKKIQNPITNDEINFHYSANGINYDLSYNETFVFPWSNIVPSGCGNAHSTTSCITNKTDHGVMLDSIVAQDGRVHFINGHGRSDIGVTGSGGNSRIQEIHLKGRTGGLLKKFQLVQNFVLSPGTTPSNKTHSRYRMYLDELKEYGADHSFIKNYKFDYYQRDQLPARLSHNKDHWGYYNGASNSQSTPLPLTNLYLLNRLQNLFPSFVPANREADESKSYFGNLSRLTYPTGGTVDYTYEGNMVAVCNDVITKESVVDSRFAQWTSSNGGETNTHDFTIDHDQLVNVDYDVRQIGFYTNGASARLINLSNGIELIRIAGSLQYLPPLDHIGTQPIWLTAGDYRIIVEAKRGPDASLPYPFNTEPEHANMIVRHLRNVSNFLTNELVGGVRIQQINIDDGDTDGTNTIIKKMVYSEQDAAGCDRSTGVFVGQMPQYMTSDISIAENGTPCDFNECRYTRISSSSINSLTRQSGQIVSYRKVWEKQGVNAENGKRYFRYDIIKDSNSERGLNAENYHLNSLSTDRSYMSGKLVEETLLSQAGDTVSKRMLEYELYETVNQHSVRNMHAKKLFSLPCTQASSYTCDGINEEGEEYYFEINRCDYDFLNGYLICDTFYNACWNKPAGFVINDLSSLDEYTAEWYQHVSQWVYLKKETSRQYALDSSGDYVETVTNYGYDLPAGRHTFPTEVQMLNSDGKITKTINRYAPQLSGNTIQNIKDWHIISSPIETEIRVDNVIIGGQRKSFASYFNEVPVNFVDPNEPVKLHTIAIRQVSWSETGDLIDDGWVVQDSIGRYDQASGYPSEVYRRGWSADKYTWVDGWMTKRQFEDFTWLYQYDANSGLMTQATDLDGQKVDYTYDVAQRLRTVTSREGNVQLTYDYHYQQGNDDRNYVKVHTDFAAALYSNYRWDEQIEYLDGLGRSVQSIDRGHSPALRDVIVSTEYDAFGRPYKVYEKYESPYQDGRYYAPPTGTPFQLTEFYANPLNQVHKITPPEWYATEFLYQTNAANEVAKLDANGGYYAANSLLKQTVIDPQGKQTISYTDRKGRQLLNSRLDVNGTQTADTYSIFDDKDRLKTVVPPGASLSSSGLIYEYLYDSRDRMIKKKVPDTEAVEMRYNKRDLLVLSQDTFLRANGIPKWMLTKYDDFGRVTQTGFYEGADPNPNQTLAFSELLTENCYDGQICNGQTNNSPWYKGKLRESKVKVLDNSNTWLIKRYDYDRYGRVETLHGNHHLQKWSYYASFHLYNYDFGDNVTKEIHRHRDANSIYRYHYTLNDYDYSGRHVKQRYRYGHTSHFTTICINSYTHKDQLKYKRLGGNLQQVDFSYNAQGWLERLNSSVLGGTNVPMASGCTTPDIVPGNSSNFQENDLFFLELKYDQLQPGLAGTAQRNGNISQAVWRVRGRERQAYAYYYDFLDRLTTANYKNLNENNSVSSSNLFTMHASYDARGNILSLDRNGYKEWNGCHYYYEADKLAYTYESGTNKLQSISDNAHHFAAEELFKANPNAGNYIHDGSGNLTYDPHKEMTIAYNHLHLPEHIQFNGTQKEIFFLYDANGTKLRKTVKDNGQVLYTQDYIEGIEYRNQVVEAVYHAEGRLYNQGVDQGTIDFRYEYAIKDHLGNIRLMFTDKDGDNIIEQTADPATSEILQENHYYPFGMKMEGVWMNDAGSLNRYGYNGKELNDDFGLEWSDYGFRFYDPAIGRFTGVDPISDQFPHVSTYNYAENEPIANIDLWGLQKYFAANADFITKNGDDEKNRVLPVKKVTRENIDLGNTFKAEFLTQNEDNEIIQVTDILTATPENNNRGKTPKVILDAFIGKKENMPGIFVKSKISEDEIFVSERGIETIKLSPLSALKLMNKNTGQESNDRPKVDFTIEYNVEINRARFGIELNFGSN